MTVDLVRLLCDRKVDVRASKLGEPAASSIFRASPDHFADPRGRTFNGLFANFTEATDEQFDSLIDTHLRGPVFLTQKLLPLIEDGGRILNVSSGFMRFTLTGYSLYAAAKAAVEVPSVHGRRAWRTRYPGERLCGAEHCARSRRLAGAILAARLAPFSLTT